MSCPAQQVAIASWRPVAGASTDGDILVLDPFTTTPVVGHVLTTDGPPIVMFSWELVELGSTPMSFGLWVGTDSSVGIFYRTDGVIVIGGVERQTLPASTGDIVQMFVDVLARRVLFTLNGTRL